MCDLSLPHPYYYATATKRQPPINPAKLAKNSKAVYNQDMSFSVGIVGLPNVGKSTLFKALTKKPVDIANYPFCTIAPNVGVVTVPDSRLDQLNALYHSEKIVPTIIEFVDIAGLVKNAHQGEGLGNQFLSHIREVDAICQVIRAFTDPNVTHVAGEVNPQSDLETINLELIMADLQTIAKKIADTEAKARSGDKELQKKLAIYSKIKNVLNQGLLASSLINENKNSAPLLDATELELIRDLNLLTLKPMLYVLNIDEKNINQKLNLGYLGPMINGQCSMIPISAKIEAELSELSPAEAKEYLASLGLEYSGLDRLIAASYQLLNLITFFTAGPKESHAWTIKKNTKAPKAAGRIHTDFELGFIKAEIINWQNLIKTGSDLAAKEKGLVRLEGKDYLIQDGDVCYFHFKA